MGIFKKIKKDVEERKGMQQITSTFKLLNGYSPIFTTFSGGIYEMAITRACIDKIATQCSKLHPVINGNKNYKELNILIQNMPNRLMTIQQFLYRLVSILLVENTAYIIPIFENSMTMKIVGFYPARAEGSKIVKLNNTEYLVYKVNNVDYACEYDLVGVLRRFYYKKDYLGESNASLHSTLDLINVQEQGIKSGIKSGATIRFLARLGIVQNPEAIKAEQQRLKEEQLSIENNGGVAIFDSKYADVQKVDSQPFIANQEQMKIIQKNVFDYFHMSEQILQNTASEDQWNLFYEDMIEPIAIQISQVLTKMLIKQQDLAKGFNVVLESTKLQFISNNTKLNVSQQLFDRGILSTNQVMDIWNLPHVPDEEDKRYIRKEYTEVINLDKEENNNDQSDGNSNEEQPTNGNSNDGEETNNSEDQTE